ncbi:MAG TPA: hypothetical protein VIM73_14155 [Polyangiaceae bacterium]
MRKLALSSLVFFTSLGPTRAHAQGTPYEELTVLRHPERVLGGHTFLAPTFFPSAFVATHFAFRQGLVQVDLGDYPLSSGATTDLSLLGVSERIEVALRFADRFQVFAGGTGEIFLGTNLRSAIVGGGSFNYRVHGGGAVRLVRSAMTGTELSLRAFGQYGPGSFFDLWRLVEGVVENDPDTAQAVVDGNLGRLTLRDTVRGEVALQLLLAHALSSTFGLQAELGAGYDWSRLTFFDLDENRDIDTHSHAFVPDLGLVFGANLGPRVPLGFLAEYSLRFGRRTLPGSEEVDEEFSQLLGLSAHLVHPQFDFGLSIARLFNSEGISRLDPEGETLTSESPAVNYLQLTLQFTWW